MVDPWASVNGGGDYRSLVLQAIVWWVVLLLVVDNEGNKHGCLFYKVIYDKLVSCCNGSLKKKDADKAVSSKKKPGEVMPEPKSTDVSQDKAVVVQELAPSVVATNVAISEPHVNSCLCLVCRRGSSLTEARSIEISIGELKVIYGPSGSGKTSMVSKLASLSTPLVNSGKIRRRYSATVAL